MCRADPKQTTGSSSCLLFWDSQQWCKLWGFMRNRGTYGSEFGLRPLLDDFTQTSKKLEYPKPNHMITSGWTPAQLELESNIALAKLNLPLSWLSNKAVVIFVLFFPIKWTNLLRMSLNLRALIHSKIIVDDLDKWSELLIRGWREWVRSALCPLTVIHSFAISPLTSQWMCWLLLWILYLKNCKKFALEKQMSSLAYLFLSWQNKPFFLISWSEVKWVDKFHLNCIELLTTIQHFAGSSHIQHLGKISMAQYQCSILQ